MKIQKTQNINFQASKVLTARSLKNGSNEMVEVFKLNYSEDKEFIKKCYKTLTNSTLEKTPHQKNLKTFFEKFLSKYGGDKEYFISIKDEEVISGGMTTLPFLKTVNLVDIFTANNENPSKKALFLGFIEDSKNSYKRYNLDLKHFKFDIKQKEREVLPRQIDYIKKKIKKQNPEIKFTFDKQNNVSLDDVLGTRDFETEVIK